MSWILNTLFKHKALTFDIHNDNDLNKLKSHNWAFINKKNLLIKRVKPIPRAYICTNCSSYIFIFYYKYQNKYQNQLYAQFAANSNIYNNRVHFDRYASCNEEIMKKACL